MSRGWGIAAVSGAVVALAGCGPAVFDPAFESTDVREAAEQGCDPSLRCVVVDAPVVGSRRGTGSCELYGPGDPDTVDPLVRSEGLQMTPGVDTVWVVAVPPDVGIDDINPVCRPMVEG